MMNPTRTLLAASIALAMIAGCGQTQGSLVPLLESPTDVAVVTWCQTDGERLPTSPDVVCAGTVVTRAVVSSRDNDMLMQIDVGARIPSLVDLDRGIPGNTGQFVMNRPTHVANTSDSRVVAVATEDPVAVRLIDVANSQFSEPSIVDGNVVALAQTNTGIAVATGGASLVLIDTIAGDVPSFGAALSLTMPGTVVTMDDAPDGSLYVLVSSPSAVVHVDPTGTTDTCAGSPCVVQTFELHVICAAGTNGCMCNAASNCLDGTTCEAGICTPVCDEPNVGCACVADACVEGAVCGDDGTCALPGSDITFGQGLMQDLAVIAPVAEGGDLLIALIDNTLRQVGFLEPVSGTFVAHRPRNDADDGIGLTVSSRRLLEMVPVTERASVTSCGGESLEDVRRSLLVTSASGTLTTIRVDRSIVQDGVLIRTEPAFMFEDSNTRGALVSGISCEIPGGTDCGAVRCNDPALPQLAPADCNFVATDVATAGRLPLLSGYGNNDGRGYVGLCSDIEQVRPVDRSCPIVDEVQPQCVSLDTLAARAPSPDLCREAFLFSSDQQFVATVNNDAYLPNDTWNLRWEGVLPQTRRNDVRLSAEGLTFEVAEACENICPYADSIGCGAIERYCDGASNICPHIDELEAQCGELGRLRQSTCELGIQAGDWLEVLLGQGRKFDPVQCAPFRGPTSLVGPMFTIDAVTPDSLVIGALRDPDGPTWADVAECFDNADSPVLEVRVRAANDFILVGDNAGYDSPFVEQDGQCTFEPGASNPRPPIGQRFSGPGGFTFEVTPSVSSATCAETPADFSIEFSTIANYTPQALNIFTDLDQISTSVTQMVTASTARGERLIMLDNGFDVAHIVEVGTFRVLAWVR